MLKRTDVAFKMSTMSHPGEYRSCYRGAQKSRERGFLVRWEEHALDNSRRDVCPLAPGHGHVLHTRRIHPRPSARRFDHLCNLT